jgi:hypothetical protein
VLSAAALPIYLAASLLIGWEEMAGQGAGARGWVGGGSAIATVTSKSSIVFVAIFSARFIASFTTLVKEASFFSSSALAFVLAFGRMRCGRRSESFTILGSGDAEQIRYLTDVKILLTKAPMNTAMMQRGVP